MRNTKTNTTPSSRLIGLEYALKELLKVKQENLELIKELRPAMYDKAQKDYVICSLFKPESLYFYDVRLVQQQAQEENLVLRQLIRQQQKKCI